MRTAFMRISDKTLALRISILACLGIAKGLDALASRFPGDLFASKAFNREGREETRGAVLRETGLGPGLTLAVDRLIIRTAGIAAWTSTSKSFSFAGKGDAAPWPRLLMSAARSRRSRRRKCWCVTMDRLWAPSAGAVWKPTCGRRHGK